MPEKVASQIAAGEVIERPFSVVRELMDNSIDAGATKIFVKIQRGGKLGIKVSDNGIGMGRDDLLLCIERHATSKIRDISDLFSVRTLGFRGEALPSMASVSKMRIISRTKEDLAGHLLTINGGKLGSIEEVGAPQGTMVEVRDLFFNVPARRKFLRTAKTETDRIADVFTRLSLSSLDIHFRLEADENVLLNLPPASDLIQRLSILLGKDVAKEMIEIGEETLGVHVQAFVAPPEFGRTRSDRMYVYVNGRNIRDRLINKAIMEGYGQRLMKGIFPQAVIFLQVDPATVDVNVHPTKQEVRFRNSQDVYRAIVNVIEKALERRRPAFIEQPLQEKDPVVLDPGSGNWITTERQVTYERPLVSERNVFQDELFDSGVHIIGQLGKTYILCQTSDGLMVIDQHAAHERIVYEKLKNDFDASRLDIQRLLIPKRIELSFKEKRILQDKGSLLKNLGIELDHFGGNTYLLRSVPAMLVDADWDRLLPELIAKLDEGRLKDEDTVDDIITLMACHSAIRSGHVLSRDEMERLLSQLDALSLPTNCPHGRPILIRISFRELEKMFKRIV